MFKKLSSQFVFVYHFYYLRFKVCLYYTALAVPCMLGKGGPLSFLVCDVTFLFFFIYFPMWCLRSSMVLDCIDNSSLPSLISTTTVEDANTRTYSHKMDKM